MDTETQPKHALADGSKGLQVDVCKQCVEIGKGAQQCTDFQEL